MLSFATEFPVRDSTADDFVASVRTWLIGSPHTALRNEHFDSIPFEGQWNIEVGREQVEMLMIRSGEQETAAVRYIARDGSLEWTTTVVFSRNGDSWVGLRTARESYSAQLKLPAALKPHVVKTILNNLKGGLDGESYVSDKPVLLGLNDVNMTTRLMNGDADNYLPIVYMSCSFTGGHPVDPAPLARVLAGMAHVLVEPDREFSRMLQINVGSRNVYGGRVGVYWPNGERSVYFINDQMPSDGAVRKTLCGDIRTALLNRRSLSRITWSQAEAQIARKAFNTLRAAGSDNIEEYVAAFDSEIAIRESQLGEAEAEIQRLKSQLRTVDGGGGSQKGVRLDTGGEQSYFDGEVTETLRDALIRASENEQDGGRRQHLIQSIVSLMPVSDSMKHRRDVLKNALGQYKSMTRDARKALEDLGFAITDDGKHIKLVYMQDGRYTFILPKTGGDGRGGMNSVSDIAKRVY